MFAKNYRLASSFFQTPLMRMMSTEIKRSGIYAGSFDPPSSGHLDIISRGTSLCDKLYVGIAINTAKKPIFSVEHREKLLQ